MLRELLKCLCLIGISLLTIPSFAQSDYCAAEQVHQRFLNNNSALLLQEQQTEQAYFTEMNGPRQKVAALYTIPVVVHIIHNNGPENLSDATVLQGIQDMNDAFANIGYYDQGTGVDTEIEFCLAIRDPDGNATTGINRVVSPLTNMTLETDDLAVKDLSRWNPYDYLNIWLVGEICSNSSGCGVAGYAYFPSAHGSNIDGSVSEADLFGSSPLNSFVQVHEVGHYLGLRHTFQGACTNNDCLIDGDAVCDTPPDGSTAGVPCGTPVNTCTTDSNSGFATDQNDMYWNYMDYGWSCPSAFTAGQRDRMQFFLTGDRSSLLASPGCLSPCTIPITANISASSNSIDIGQTVNFNNTTSNATNYEWTIDGTAFATSMNSSYTFNTLGTFEIIMTATNADPNCFASDTVYVEVNCPATADFSYTLNGSDATFTNNSTGASSYTWTVDDGTGSTIFSTATNPNYTFSGTGWFAVCLEAETALCNDADCQYIFISDGGTVDFEIVNYYGTTGNDYFDDIIYNDSDNTFFGIGSSDIQTDRQAIITKLDNCGEILWTKHYFAEDAATWHEGLMMQDGNLLVLGAHNISGVRRQRVVAKINSMDGSIIWMKTYQFLNRSAVQKFFASVGDPAGETYYLSTWILNSSSFDDYGILKLDNNGNLIFERRYQWSGDNQMSAFPVFGGGFATFGSASGNSWTPTLSIFNNNGDFVSGNAYPGLPELVADSQNGMQTPDGGFMLVGTSRISGFVYPTVTRIDENYNLQWSRVEGTNYQGRYDQIVRDIYNNYYVMGRTNVGGTVHPKISKFDENYNYLWTKYLDITSGGSTNAQTLSLRTTGTDPDKIMVVDYGLNNALGLGGIDAFVAVLDTALNSCITQQINPAISIFQSNRISAQPTEIPLSTIPGTYSDIGDLTYTTGEICTVSCPEICDNGLDDDDDGLVDCDDPECDCPVIDCENTFLQLIGSPSLDEEATAIADLPFGGFILGGSRGDSTLIIRMGSDGSIVWSRTFDFVSGDEFLANMIIDSNGFILGIGRTIVSNPRVNYAFKYDHLSDNIIWSNIMDNPTSSAYWDIIEKAAGDNYFVTGQSANNSSPGLGCDGLVLELDRNTGVKLAEYNYNFGSCETFQAAKIYNNQLYVTGRYNNAGGGTAAMRSSLSQLDFAGNEIWSRMYLVNTSTPARLYSTDFLIENDEIFVVSHGDMNGTAANDISFQFYKTDINGNIIWAKEYDTPAPNNDERPTELRSLPDGFLILGTYASASYGKNGFLIKTDKQGVLQWSKEFPLNNGDDSFHDIIIKDDFIYIAGSALGSSGTGQDILLLKLNLDGEVSDDCPIGNTFTVSETDLVNPFDALRDLTEFNVNISLTNNPKTATPSPLALEEMICETPCDEICDNTIDDDGDGLPDCLDPDCDCDNACLPEFPPLDLGPDITVCENGVYTFNAGSGYATYEWQDGATDSTYTAYTAGMYWIEVSDGCGNFQLDTVAIFIDPISQIELADTTICAGDSVILSISTFFDNFTWIPPDGLNCVDCQTVTASPDTTTTYTIIGTTLLGCVTVDTVTVTIEDCCAMEIDIPADSTLCTGNTASLAVNFIQDGTQPYIFDWSNGADTPGISNLGAGIYSVTVTDADMCTATASTEVTQAGGLIANANVIVQVACFGDCNGSATATPTGGTAPLTYQWDNSESTATATALCLGIHSVTIIDANGCQDTAQVIITEPLQLNAGSTTTGPVSCFGGDGGTASTSATGGTPPYTYNWNTTPAQTGATATGLSAGLYTVTIADANNCFVQLNITVTQPASPLVTTIAGTNPTCENDGSVTVIPTGGTPSYTYIWSNSETTSSVNNIGAGIYQVTVSDANSCSTTASIELTDPIAMTATAIGEALSCNDSADGNISLTVNNGTAPYIYQWDNGAGTNQNPSGLGVGIYTVTATDVNMCTVTASAEITAPAILSASASGQDALCFGSSDGQGTVIAIGGTVPYTYLWDNNETTNPAIFLNEGQHNVTITDLNGCQTEASVQINSPNPLVPSLFSTPTSCFGGNDGSATVSASGGTAPYTYNWNTTPAQTGAIAIDLPAGVVQVIITDTNGCALPPINVTITQPNEVLFASISNTAPLCNGSADGSATVVPTGGVASYTYQWSNGAIGQTAFDLQAGNYSVTITDANGCTYIDNTSLADPAPILAVLTADDVICYNDENSSILVEMPSGGTAPYTYSLDGETFVPSDFFGGLAAGNYTVYVQDVNACENQFAISINQPFELLVDLGVDITLELSDSVQLFAQTNTFDSLSYSWTPSTGLSCTDCPNPLVQTFENTSYEVMVTDSNGCTAISEITIDVNKDRNIYIPNVFSPNFDGINDIFMIYAGKGVGQIGQFSVYDRWGELLFEAKDFPPNDSSFGWDGTFKNKPLNPNVFVYYIEVTFVDGTTIPYKGDVTLVR